MPQAKDKNKSQEESFKEYVRQRLDNHDMQLKTFSSNLGAIARFLGVSPKNLVKALYSEKLNSKYFMSVINEEHKYFIKLQQPKSSIFKKLINFIKSIFMEKPQITITEKYLKNHPELKDKFKVGDIIPNPKYVSPENQESLAKVAAAPQSAKPIVVEGKNVVAILQDGKETETHYHCKMSDGTTMHVDKTLFAV